MIADLKPYPAMKDCGALWLGEVPAHWEVRRLRNAAELRVSNVDKHTKEGELPVRLCNYVDVYKRDRICADQLFMASSATRDEVERFRLKRDDVLITKDSESWNDIGVPALVDEPADDLISGYHLAILRPYPDAIEGAYLFRAVQSNAIAYQFHVEAKGVTRYGLSQAAIKSVWLPVPPLSEQSAIVYFLDYADRRIRRYICAKRELIDLLEEEKKAIIHRAVTRGLAPDLGLGPSGVHGVGDVPNQWKVMPIKRVLTSLVYGISDSATDGGAVRLLTMANIQDGSVSIPDNGGVDCVDPELLLREGDLLFNRTNSAELVGKVGLFRGAGTPVTFASYLVRLRPRPEHDPEFLNLLLNDQSVLSVARREAVPSLHQSNLNPTRYGRLRITLPSLDEQRAIVGFVRGAAAGVDSAIDRARSEIVLLREYHTRLVTDVVTGKLDVRGLAERIRAEARESDARKTDRRSGGRELELNGELEAE